MKRLQVIGLRDALSDEHRARSDPGEGQASKEVLVSGNVYSNINPDSTSTSGSILFGLGYFI